MTVKMPKGLGASPDDSMTTIKAPAVKEETVLVRQKYGKLKSHSVIGNPRSVSTPEFEQAKSGKMDKTHNSAEMNQKNPAIRKNWKGEL